MTGFHNNVNSLTAKVADGSVRATRNANKIILSGKTYDHKDFLKSQFSACWDSGAKAWVVDADALSEGSANLLDEILGTC